MAAIEINGISKRYRAGQAVRDLSFTVEAGRCCYCFAWIGAAFTGGAALLRIRDVD